MSKVKAAGFDKRGKLGHFSDLCYQAELLLIEISEKVSSGKRENFRTLVAIHLLALMLNNAHSIKILLRNGNTYSAAILVRALIEQWVNLRYIYVSSNYERLVRYLFSGDELFIKNARDAAKAFRENNFEGSLDPFIDDAEGSIQYRVISKNRLKKYGHAMKRMPPFLERVKEIVNLDQDLETMFWYHYDYSTYSNNVHSSKEKVIQMTYAETYEDWFQANTYDGLEDCFRIINTSGAVISKAFLFFARRHHGFSHQKFHVLRKTELYVTHVGEYQRMRAEKGHRSV